jgi:RNA polymerase sigma factor (sigma-70 family)
MMMMMTAASVTGRLVERARDPDAPLHEKQAAFTELVGQSQHFVFALALARLRDAEEAKDAAQDAFATAWVRLPQLRDPSAFEPWLKSMVARECSRRLRRRQPVSAAAASPAAVPADTRRLDYQRVIATQLARLSEGDRQLTVLFYFLGYDLTQIAALLRLRPGTVAKRLHAARLRIRRGLPRSVRGEFVPSTPSEAFAERVRRGLLDDYVGRYRFDRRPDHVITILREGDTLISEASGQRHVLACGGEHSLLTSQYDGEGRFRRNRRGQVTDFVYYEFGKRMGIARRLDARSD